MEATNKKFIESKYCNYKGTQQSFLLQQNQTSSCCRAYSEPLDTNKSITDYHLTWQHEKQQLAQGVKLDGCKHCWESEDQGKISYRLTNTDKNTPIQIQLFLSNLCNHMCSYCSPKYSSLWEKSMQTHGIFQNISSSVTANLKTTHSPTDTNYWLEQIQNYINTCDDHSVVLILLGGEPLMQQQNLKKLLNFNSKKIKNLMVQTNLNPPTNKFLIWILDNIPMDKLKIDISIDASPDYNHIPRAGFDRTKFLSNLKLLQNNNVVFKFNSVVSVLAMFDFENFIPWIHDNKFKVRFSKLNNPDCLNGYYVPFRFREKIWKKINHLTLDPIVTELLQHPDNTVDLKLLEQYNYLLQYFERSNIDPTTIDNEIFGEYWAWLAVHVKEKFRL